MNKLKRITITAVWPDVKTAGPRGPPNVSIFKTKYIILLVRYYSSYNTYSRYRSSFVDGNNIMIRKRLRSGKLSFSKIIFATRS